MTEDVLERMIVRSAMEIFVKILNDPNVHGVIEMGPYHYDCPEYILDLLSPLQGPPFSRVDGSGDEAAWEWRQTCRAVAQAKKDKNKTN